MNKNKSKKYSMTFKDGRVTTSWYLVDWIIHNSKFKKNARLVAIQIASHYNVHEQVAFPSYETLAESTGLSRSAVAQAVKELKEEGQGTEWKITKRKSAHYYQPSNHYEFIIPRKSDL